MLERRAETLLDILFDQLDALSTLDMKDDYQVANACKATAAVNKTVRTILDVVDCSIRANQEIPMTSTREQARAFFGDGVPRPKHIAPGGEVIDYTE